MVELKSGFSFLQTNQRFRQIIFENSILLHKQSLFNAREIFASHFHSTTYCRMKFASEVQNVRTAFAGLPK